MTVMNLLSGLLGAMFGAATSLMIYLHGHLSSEKFFFRERRAETARQLFMMRYCLQANYTPSLEEARKFNEALNVIPFDFSGDKAVIEIYNQFIVQPRDTSILIELIRALTESAKIRRRLDIAHASRAHAISGSDERNTVDDYQGA